MTDFDAEKAITIRYLDLFDGVVVFFGPIFAQNLALEHQFLAKLVIEGYTLDFSLILHVVELNLSDGRALWDLLVAPIGLLVLDLL